MEEQIIQEAVEHVDKNLQIRGNWKVNRNHQEYDLELVIHNERFVFHAAIKRDVRNHHLEQLFDAAQQWDDFIIVAERLYPKVKEILRERKIAYLEGNGNLFIYRPNVLIWIDTNAPIATKRKSGNRAFTKTGLKVVFQFLMDIDLIKASQRVIAEAAGVGLGNVPQVISGLKETGYLLKKDRSTYLVNDRKALLDKWVTEYEAKLKPGLFVGNFRFQKTSQQENWKELALQMTDTVWGGEAAGDLLTNYLRPEQLTLYTNESRKNLMLKFNLIPDENGPVKVYKKFWVGMIAAPLQTAPPIVVYADLVYTDDKRCIETAQMIWNEFIQPNL